MTALAAKLAEVEAKLLVAQQSVNILSAAGEQMASVLDATEAQLTAAHANR